MSKEEKIKEVYGIHFGKCNPDENGWSKYQLNDKQELISEFAINSIMPCEFNNFRQDNAKLIYCVRPKSLQGIEDNNGWIKIESEADFPKIGTYDMSASKLMYWTNGCQYEANDYKKLVLHYPHLEITHYQFIQIIKLNEPLY